MSVTNIIKTDLEFLNYFNCETVKICKIIKIYDIGNFYNKASEKGKCELTLSQTSFGLF